ncbi:hypothetical protein MLD38_028957 [Melastoma candidum]|uniref:Uncharacterized protein n=1 Tax=Melastoma candidum TaxID=119954 RepID=A0ACB9N2M6_9MYRT|nr:hypothetical protein MLD38_028957 [Melastoma candidum]
METVVGSGGNEGKIEDSGTEGSPSLTSSCKQIADPVVYKLVRVEVDGRLVPATDDEIMEVVDMLKDDNSGMPIIAESRETLGTATDGSSSGKSHSALSGFSKLEDLDSDAEKLDAQTQENAAHTCPEIDLTKGSGSEEECPKSPEPISEGGKSDHDSQMAKRLRKPTRRYIEELSEVDDGALVPCISRARRSRPRKDVMALVILHHGSTEMESAVATVDSNRFRCQPPHDTADTGQRSKSTEEMDKPVEETENYHTPSATEEVGMASKLNSKLRVGNSNFSSVRRVAVAKSRGRIWRKHHRAWTLSEVLKLVEGVSRYGAGRWSEIKRLSFAPNTYRTSVDLKDKWRNLLKACYAPAPADNRMNARKPTSTPIPESILLRVRQLAEMNAQTPPPNLNLTKRGGCDDGGIACQTLSGHL